MTTKSKRFSMTEALKEREDVIAFLEAGKPKAGNENPANQPTASRKPPEERIAVTVRLPKSIAHALIDSSAERRKNRQKASSQQDIVSTALADWFKKTH